MPNVANFDMHPYTGVEPVGEHTGTEGLFRVQAQTLPMSCLLLTSPRELSVTLEVFSLAVCRPLE